MEALEQTHPGEDEDKAHKSRANDAPKEHTVLVLRRHLEIGENKNEDKNIVNAQAELDEVAGEPLQRGVDCRATTKLSH